MTPFNLTDEIRAVVTALGQDEELKAYVDSDYAVPAVYRGEGPIRLVVLGQDPTIQDATKRAAIKHVLNLDRNGSARAYLARVCLDLGLDLKQHLYATNVLKNFFVQPPTGVKDFPVFARFSSHWLPLLRQELTDFPCAPIMTLGEPVLGMLVKEGGEKRLRRYWGYRQDWQKSPPTAADFRHVPASENVLGRDIFPLPHQPSLRKTFYRSFLRDYLAYVRRTAFG